MVARSKNPMARAVWLLSAAAAVGLVTAGIFMARIVSKDEGMKRKRQVQMVSLLRPPPPPPAMKEKLPETQTVDKPLEQALESEQPKEEPQAESPENADDQPPAGDELGLDSAGGSGSDSFGLRAKKGGRSLTAGDFSGSSGFSSAALMKKFGWYTQMLQDEIRKQIHQQLETNGGMPSGHYQTLVQITLNEQGSVVSYEIDGSSGNPEIDTALRSVLQRMNISEPPPDGMPRTLKLRITSQG